MSARVEHAELERLVPHKGSMCLLDSVESWDDVEIRCEARSHHDPAHPLRERGRLAAVHLVEYAAQATAVHSGLFERRRGGAPRPGLLVALRDIQLRVARCDDIAAPLTILARRLVSNAGGWLYAFEVKAGERLLATGRVGVLPSRPTAAQRS
ncbi:MAG TPA: phosphotransferase [Candidatus Binatia bacterium]|nr:phosphotransferase [Candidatus Binatia bacterium]